MSGSQWSKAPSKNGKRILCKTENFVPIVVVVPGLASSSSASSSSTSFQQDSPSTSSCPASSRSDEEASGNRCDNPKNKKKQIKMRTTNKQRAVDRAISQRGQRISQIISKIQKCQTNVATRKHSICTHFFEDRNCEVCKRTKITRVPCRMRTGEALPQVQKNLVT